MPPDNRDSSALAPDTSGEGFPQPVLLTGNVMSVPVSPPFVGAACSTACAGLPQLSRHQHKMRMLAQAIAPGSEPRRCCENKSFFPKRRCGRIMCVKSFLMSLYKTPSPRYFIQYRYTGENSNDAQ